MLEIPFLSPRSCEECSETNTYGRPMAKGIRPSPIGNSRPGILFVFLVISKVTPAPSKISMEHSIDPLSPSVCNAEEARIEYARKSPIPTIYSEKGRVMIESI